ncbi:DNA polymerase eta-like protein, partial [Leptotrombidium deliense]
SRVSQTAEDRRPSMAPIVALIDMDCFYVQVHQRMDPSTRNQPAVVVQYNPWRGGGILSVNYEARNHGVTRAMRGDDARDKCPGIHVFQVPEEREKADLTKYRDASAEVFDVICNFSDLITVEKASIDEAFLDLTKLIESYTDFPSFDSVCETYLPECNQCSEQSTDTYDCCFAHFYNYVSEQSECPLSVENRNFIIAAKIVKDIRDEIFKRTEFRCSAGISSSKMLSKLCCAMRKPNGQTILPSFAIAKVLSTTPVNKVRNLGGKLGEEVRTKLGIQYMGDIKTFTLSQLTAQFGNKTAVWLMAMANGVDDDEVVTRLIAKSIGCSKQFPAVQKTSLKTKSDVAHWVSKLVDELVERLNKDRIANQRVAKLVNISMRFASKDSVTRSLPLRCYDANVINEDLMRNIVSRILNNVNGANENLKEPVVLLSLSSSKFVDSLQDDRNTKLESFYKKVEKPINSTNSPCISSNTSCPPVCTSSAPDVEVLTEECAFPIKFPQKRGFFYRKTLELMGMKECT